MTKEEFDALQIGDLVRRCNSGEAYIITEKLATGLYTVVRRITMANPREWDHVEPGGSIISTRGA